MAASIFYAIIVASQALYLWISTRQLTVATLAINVAVISFYSNIPVEAWPYIALLNILGFAIAYFYRPTTPTLER